MELANSLLHFVSVAAAVLLAAVAALHARRGDRRGRWAVGAFVVLAAVTATNGPKPKPRPALTPYDPPRLDRTQEVGGSSPLAPLGIMTGEPG